MRILFVIAAFMTALFVERDALNFGVMQMLVAVLLMTALVGVAALLRIPAADRRLSKRCKQEAHHA